MITDLMVWKSKAEADFYSMIPHNLSLCLDQIIEWPIPPPPHTSVNHVDFTHTHADPKDTAALSHPISLWWKARVSSDAAQQVQLALPMPAEVDRTWCNVDVHEVVHNTTLDMVLNSVHQISGAHVEDLNVGQIPNTQKEEDRIVLNMRVIC